MALNIGSSLLTKQDGLYGLQARYLHLTQYSTAAKKTFLNEFEGCDSDYEQDNSNSDIRTAGYNQHQAAFVPKNGIGRLAESLRDKKLVKYRFQVFGPLNSIDTLVSFPPPNDL